MEQHVRDEITRQLDYYVDAYRKVRDIDLSLADLSQRMSELSAERAEAEELRDMASEAVSRLAEDLPEADEDAMRELVADRLSGLVGLMVF